jgi:capsular exopolysaccharide synthesis family protein
MTAPAQQLVSLVAPSSMEADQYRGLRHNIERMRRDAGVQMLAITSPGPGDGKSVTTLNLAGALAQSPDTRVLVVDADLHRPSVAEYLGLDQPTAPGLVDLILNQDLSFGQVVRRLDALNLSVLLPGVCRAGAYELLNSPRLPARLKEARSGFDYVVIDTPPLLPLPDCRLIGQWVDGFIVLVTAHRTPRKALAEALGLLEPAKVLGTVFNGDDRPLAPYGSYYGYYGRHEVAPHRRARASH